MNKENYIRVSSVLSPYSGLDKIPPEIVANAARRGTNVHKICEAIMSGLGEYGVTDELSGYIESFKKWFPHDQKIIEIEKRFWCDDLKITGQVDIILETSEGLAIVDLKTSYKPSKTWPLQGSGYYYLAKKNLYDIKKIYFIHLQKNGTQAHIYEYETSFEPFLNILKDYRREYESNNSQ